MHYDNFRWTMRKKGSVGGLEGDVKFEILAIKHIFYMLITFWTPANFKIC